MGGIAVGFQVGGEFVHERINGVDVNALVDDFAGLFLDVDRPSPPPARAVFQVVVHHHEMKVLDELSLEAKSGLPLRVGARRSSHRGSPDGQGGFFAGV